MINKAHAVGILVSIPVTNNKGNTGIFLSLKNYIPWIHEAILEVDPRPHDEKQYKTCIPETWFGDYTDVEYETFFL